MIKKHHELATWISAAYRCLIDDGYDADAIMNEANFDFLSLTSSTEQIPKSTAARIWQAIESTTQDDAYCLKVLPHLSDPYVNALITSLQASGSIKNALQVLLKYYRIVHPSITISTSMDQSFKVYISGQDNEIAICNQDIDITLCLMAKYSAMLLSNKIQPIALRLSRTTPQNKASYLQHYQCPVFFEAKENSIEFPLAILDADIPGADPNLSSYLEQYLSEQMKEQASKETPFTLEHRVKDALTERLPEGTPKLKHIASALDMSERTLQRKLFEAGLNYTALLNQTRIELAKHHLLTNDSLTVQSIASRLGFTESGNFIRFFKQHTGYTPSDYANHVTLP